MRQELTSVTPMPVCLPLYELSYWNIQSGSEGQWVTNSLQYLIYCYVQFGTLKYKYLIESMHSLLDMFISTHHPQHTACAYTHRHTHTHFWVKLTMNGGGKLWQKYSNGIWECSQAIRDKKSPRYTKCSFGLLHKCSQSQLYFWYPYLEYYNNISCLYISNW